MAATIQQPPRNDPAANLHVNLYPRTLMDDIDFRDNRYPPLSKPILQSPPQQDQLWDRYDPQSFQRSFEPSNSISGWPAGQSSRVDSQYQQTPSRQSARSPGLLSTQSQSQEPQRTSLSYALPSGASRRVVERYSLEDNGQRAPSRASTETRPTLVESNQDTGRSRTNTPQPTRLNELQSRDRPVSILPATPRRPAAPSSSASPNALGGSSQFPPVMPLSASPTYNPPVAPKHRTYPQQPTYITPPDAPNPINTVYSPSPPLQEEVCVECAMRDQDMADVDVASPGVWERASDVLFEDLVERELQDEANGVVVVDDSSRPKARGGRLTEQNLKIWISINPREPASRQQTLNTYIKSQRALLQAEALAHARAMQEAKQLDNRMRDTYSQLRRSAYDMGAASSPADDFGGVRIKPPQSPSSPTNIHVHTRSQSREITLLENGMIVEHVDVRKEEREARERRRKEEKRARKSSRSSVMDVTSIISAQSYGPPTDNGLKPYSRYSHSSSARPTSVLTAPPERPDLPRVYSQASFSEVHSLGSGSPRRTRFFGIRNLSAGWMSQDSLAPSGMSGSMVDMHVALQREAQGPSRLTTSPIDLRGSRHSQIWPPTQQEAGDTCQTAFDEKSKKKKNGLAKIWRIVTGTKAEADREQRKNEKLEDDFPLAPPPPLSYLVERGPSELLQSTHRHASTPSVPSMTSPRLGLSSSGMSPPTAPSSVLPSPTSSRPPGPEADMVEVRTFVHNYPDDQDNRQNHEDNIGKTQAKFVYPVTSEPDLRLQNPPLAPLVPNRLSREKSLPPLPPGEAPARQSPDSRPQTVYTYTPQLLPPGSGPAHDFLPPQAPFRNGDTRRQSFGGMTSQPNLRLQTMPASKAVEFDGRRSLGPRYDEFGLSRRSLGRLEHVQEHPTRSASPVPSTKRKSKFGFASFLGKKQPIQKQESFQDDSRLQFPSMRQFDYEAQDDPATNGYATSTSRHSALSMGASNNPNLRMSVTSRKALEDLVDQDPDFVAYRYPSNDQQLDLLR